MALKVQNTVKRDTNVPGILRWNNHRAIIKYNWWELQLVGLNWDLMIKSSVLSLFNLNLQEIRNSKGTVNTKIHDENLDFILFYLE